VRPRTSLVIALLLSVMPMGKPFFAQENLPAAPYGHFQKVAVDTGEHSRLTVKKNWDGRRQLGHGVSILVLAGHADSQKISGAGTNGFAVAVMGEPPMEKGMTDEAFWNLATAKRIAELGRQRGLNIEFYDPGVRTIYNGDDPRTNWSVGKRHVEKGGYALEIHYDAYGHHGYGSGVIPRFYGGYGEQTVIDEHLAKEFGSFPRDFRGVLGAPKRGITMLEVGKLEGDLENKLRNPQTRDGALNTIADRVVRTMAQALGLPPRFFQVPPLPSLPPSTTIANEEGPLPPPTVNMETPAAHQPDSAQGAMEATTGL